MPETSFEHCVEVACRRLRRFREQEFLERDPEWLMAWFEFSLRHSDHDPSFVTLPKDRVPYFVDRARESRHVFELAKYTVASRLRAGVSTPQPLGRLVAEFLSGEFQHSESGRKNRQERTWARDYALIETMKGLLETLSGEEDEGGVIAVRNPLYKSKNKSADFSLSEVMEKAVALEWPVRLGQRQIEEIWNKGPRKKKIKEIHDAYLLSLVDDMNEVEWI